MVRQKLLTWQLPALYMLQLWLKIFSFDRFEEKILKVFISTYYPWLVKSGFYAVNG